MFTGVQISEIVYWLKLDLPCQLDFMPPILTLSLSLEFSGKCSYILRNQYQ